MRMQGLLSCHLFILMAPPPHFSHSMDKLFDLMAMGVKYQLYCASRLEQMLEVCVNTGQCVNNVFGYCLFSASRLKQMLVLG